MALKHWTLEVDDAGFAWVVLDVADRSVNVLTHAVTSEMAVLVETLEKNADIKALGLLCGKVRGFVYGADINEFDRFTTEAEVAEFLAFIHGIFNRFAALPFPKVVGVNGFALGGGLELSLLFDRILAVRSSATQFSFPEVKLGLMPGYGGTGRAYARIGAGHVLDMMLSGRMVGADEALEIGLIDSLVHEEVDLKSAVAGMLEGMLDSPAESRSPSRGVESREDIGAAVFEAEAKYTGRLRADHTPAPFAILDHISCHAPDSEAISSAERVIFPSLMTSRASKGLRRVYRLTDMVKKTARGASGIERVHVIGAGVMGGDIAAVAALSGFEVTLFDMRGAAIEAACMRASGLFERRLQSRHKVDAAMMRLRSDEEGLGVSDADLVIEAVSERLDIKQSVLSDAERGSKAGAILASNTSSIRLEAIGEGLADPSRLIGLHFFNPVSALPLVEVIYSAFSDMEAVARGMAFAGQLKKLPIKCRSSGGFVVNRGLLPYINGAVGVFLSGEVLADAIDEAVVGYGLPMGPLELADQIGIDVMLAASESLENGGLEDAVADRYREMIEAGRLGRKSGQGFYEWDGRQAVRPRGVYEAKAQAVLASRLLAPMVEACRAVVAEGVVDSADFVDAAMIFGIGFPGWRGGVLYDADYASRNQEVV